MDTFIAQVIGDVALVLVLVVSSLSGAVARRCGQPSVVGQILAGILRASASWAPRTSLPGSAA